MASPLSSPPNAQPPGTVFILSAIGLGVLAVIINVVWANSVVQTARETSFSICTINRTVYPDKDHLQKEDFTVLAIPARFADAFKAIGALTKEEAENYAGQSRPFYRTVLQNDILRHSAFDSTTAQAAYRQPDPGKAFKAIVINDVRTPAGLHPGSIVDIVASFAVPGNPMPRAMVVKEHVELVGVGAVTQEDTAAGRQTGHYRTVTIEIPEAERTTWIDIERTAVGQYFDILERNKADTNYKDSISPEVITLLSKVPAEVPPRPLGRPGRTN